MRPLVDYANQPMPMPRWCPLLFATVALVATAALTAAGCSFKVNSWRADGVPATLLGEWQGTWASTGTQGDGQITVRVQEFDGAPVVDVLIDNPCVTPQSYAFSLSGSTIELRAGDAIVLRASLGEERMLTGEYDCPEDAGSWAAAWQGELPAILDLSGEWTGTVTGPGAVTAVMELELAQMVRSGSVSLHGAIAFPELMPGALPLIGTVRFRDGAFDVILDTTSGVIPALRMAGVGDAATVAIEAGIIIASGGLPLPTTGVWNATQSRD